MITLAEKSRTLVRTKQRACNESGRPTVDWRARLLADLCDGPEGTKLRRLMNERNGRSLVIADARPAHRQTRTSPSQCARAIGALRRLRAIRTAAPAETARHELRIRFALDRVDESLDPANGPLRADRIRTALEILDSHVSRAERFIAAVWAGFDVTRAA
jgi:hypothetical protein